MKIKWSLFLATLFLIPVSHAGGIRPESGIFSTYDGRVKVTLATEGNKIIIDSILGMRTYSPFSGYSNTYCYDYDSNRTFCMVVVNKTSIKIDLDLNELGKDNSGTLLSKEKECK